MMRMILGIDASRNRSGGAIANIIGVLGEGDPPAHGFREVHLWGYKKLLGLIPDAPWLIKHAPSELEASLYRQVWWQYRHLPREARRVKCDVLYSTDASTVCRFRPLVVMSQDMLSYEPGVIEYFGFTLARLRLIAILVLQNRAMRYADGVIFLTQYAARIIQQKTGGLGRTAIIPHGIDQTFKVNHTHQTWSQLERFPIRCLYVSNIAMYKHQWHVIRAISKLREKGYNISLTLAGGGAGKALGLVESELARSDPNGHFVVSLGPVRHEYLPMVLREADIFIFASSCENLPVTLLEGMAAGLPIACSNRGPMTEVLKDGGVYFDPEDWESISDAIEQIILDENLRNFAAERAKELSGPYSWNKCASETLEFLKTIAEDRKA